MLHACLKRDEAPTRPNRSQLTAGTRPWIFWVGHWANWAQMKIKKEGPSTKPKKKAEDEHVYDKLRSQGHGGHSPSRWRRGRYAPTRKLRPEGLGEHIHRKVAVVSAAQRSARNHAGTYQIPAAEGAVAADAQRGGGRGLRAGPVPASAGAGGVIRRVKICGTEAAAAAAAAAGTRSRRVLEAASEAAAEAAAGAAAEAAAPEAASGTAAAAPFPFFAGGAVAESERRLAASRA